MKRQSFHAMQVVKREEKETKLVQFVLGEIASGRVALKGHWKVVSLSMDSPVIAALRRVISDLGGAPALQVNVVLTRLGKHELACDFEGMEQLAIRTTQSSRLLDAHEQLVLGAASSWTGDCMRRDPRERDAFETFGSNDAELAQWAFKSFERLWVAAQPLNVESKRSDGQDRNADVDALVAGDGSNNSPLVAATSRH